MQSTHSTEKNLNSTRCVEHPSVSIILCTSGGRPTLIRCLEELTAQAQQCPNSEVIVVLNRAEDAAFAKLLSRFPVRLLNESRRGVSVARNHAVHRSKGDILIFVDDDVRVSPGWLAEIIKGFDAPNVCCVTGRVIPAGSPSLTAERSGRYYSSLRALSPWTLDASNPGWYQRIVGEPVGFGCNMAFRKSFLKNYSLFPPDLGAGSLIGGGDEFYMYVQVLKHGFRIRHNPAAAVTHYFDNNAQNQKARSAQLYAGSVAFALKLLIEEKGLRLATVRWLLSAFKRRARRVWEQKKITSEPQELLSPGEKLHAYLRGPGVYWKSRRSGISKTEGHDH
ncbi:MAG TPA: glycosyltransferase family 2 protein [Terriglobia bacterium]|nr:glycosyltransferase family 2 protein [Terriglobia bacterium]